MHPSGKGSGEDLSSYHLNNWRLTPGYGGAECIKVVSQLQHYGGGGGGVLVNGDGPQRDERTQGEGYGGGGGGCAFTKEGLPGVILIEVVP